MILGIDTSNYTTSAALLGAHGAEQQKMLLPVRQGELGLRQSDAVFHHVQQLPQVLDKLFSRRPGAAVTAVGVSTRPRPQQGSYMPCFTVGQGTAQAISLALGVPLHCFSHQEGHIAAALYSAKQLPFLRGRFLAFHVSGGTTEAVLVQPGEERLFTAEIVARSLDLKAGQAIDRVGAMLGLSFPAGRALEALALNSSQSYRPHPSLKGADCSLSGVQNQCEKLWKSGAPAEDVALFCLRCVQAALNGMTEALLKEYGPLPLLFAGGVMSNSILRRELTKKFGAAFAEPAFSADNAAGAAVLAALREGELTY